MWDVLVSNMYTIHLFISMYLLRTWVARWNCMEARLFRASQAWKSHKREFISQRGFRRFVYYLLWRSSQIRRKAQADNTHNIFPLQFKARSSTLNRWNCKMKLALESEVPGCSSLFSGGHLFSINITAVLYCLFNDICPTWVVAVSQYSFWFLRLYHTINLSGVCSKFPVSWNNCELL